MLSIENEDPLPFFATGPVEVDVFMVVVAGALIFAVLGFGVLYFAIQAIPEKMAKGASKLQLQLIGFLGLISLLTFNNGFWIASLLLAAIPIDELVSSKTRREPSSIDSGLKEAAHD